MRNTHLVRRLARTVFASFIAWAIVEPLPIRAQRPDPPSAPVVARTDQAAASKPQGVTRIGVLSPVVEFQGYADTQQLGTQILTIVVSYLQAPTIEVIPLKAKVAAAAALEAKTIDCDDVLTVHVVRVSTKSKGGLLGIARHLPLSALPGVGALAGSTAGLVAVEAASVAASAAAGLSATTQPKDTLTFEYSLSGVASGEAVASNKSLAQAKQAGEDLITPMVSAMANAIVPRLLGSKK